MTVIIPLPTLTTEDVLYNSRTTRYRWEVLTHNPTTGVDSLAGFLDGVVSGSLQWEANASVKGGGSVKVADLAAPRPGYLDISAVNLVTARLRPVLVIDGLPEIPLGVFVITAAPESWEDTGRTYSLELHDKATVLDQDAVDGSFTATTGTPILTLVSQVVSSAGERITVDATDTRGLTTGLVWEAGTSKLTIVNDLLSALGYNSLWMDGNGNLQATPYVRPAARGVRYDIVNAERTLLDGDASIYLPEWSRDQDSFSVPNKVVAVQSGSGDVAPLVGSASNTDPNSPYSIPSRGRTIVATISGVEVPADTTANQTAFLNAKARAALIAYSSPQAEVQVKHLPLPLRVSDVLRFRHVPAGIDARHVVTRLALECAPTGLMTSTLQEVVDL